MVRPDARAVHSTRRTPKLSLAPLQATHSRRLRPFDNWKGEPTERAADFVLGQYAPRRRYEVAAAGVPKSRL